MARLNQVVDESDLNSRYYFRYPRHQQPDYQTLVNMSVAEMENYIRVQLALLSTQNGSVQFLPNVQPRERIPIDPSRAPHNTGVPIAPPHNSRWMDRGVPISVPVHVDRSNWHRARNYVTGRQNNRQSSNVHSFPKRPPEDFLHLYTVKYIYKRNRQMDPCAVCLENFETEELVRRLPCMHVFHCDCVDTWLVKSDGGSCPMCRTPLEPNLNSCATLPTPPSINRIPINVAAD